MRHAPCGLCGRIIIGGCIPLWGSLTGWKKLNKGVKWENGIIRRGLYGGKGMSECGCECGQATMILSVVVIDNSGKGEAGCIRISLP